NDELPTHEQVEELSDLEVRGERLERAAPKDATHERSALQQLLLAGFEPVDPCSDQRLHGVRNALDAPSVAKRMGDLLEEKRVALCAREHDPALRRRHLTAAEERIGERLAVAPTKWREIDRARAADASAP